MKIEQRPTVVGEVLFDCFPDGSNILGGAPFNVAWHLHGLGLSPLMVTSVGDDALGRRVLDTMEKWGMDTSGVQVTKQNQTGRVTVTFADGEPSYDIVTDQAYDHLDAMQAKSSIDKKKIDKNKYSMLYHGTLIARSPHSQAVLKELKHHLGLPIFVDINLRPPWWQLKTVKESISGASWVKMNQDELATVMDNRNMGTSDIQATAERLFAEYELEMLIVTLGAKGAFCVSKAGTIQGAPAQASKVVDTVGAGDSFSAVMIAGVIQDWPRALTLKRALDFAAAICEIRGATTSDRHLYENFLSQWYTHHE